MKKIIIAGLVVVAITAVTAAAAASAKVRLVSITSPVATGSMATLTVAVSPGRRCSIAVYYSTTASHAQGLSPKSGNRITWTWKVGSRTKPGRWPIVVSCGSSGTLRTSFVVQ